MVVSWRGVEVFLWASFSGCPPILDGIREAFCLFVIPINVGTGQSGVHISQWLENKWWNHPYGGSDNQWGGRGKTGHGDYLLSPWSGKGGVIWSALHLTPAGLFWTEHSGGQIIYQLPLPPLGGSSSFLNLDITSLSLYMLTTQFPLDQLCLCLWWLLPYSPTQVILPGEAEDKELKSIPSFRKHLGKALRRITTCQIPYCCWFLPLSSFFIKKRACRPRRGLASAWLWHGYKVLPGQEPNLSES